MSWLISSSLLKKMFFHDNERPHCPRYIKEVMIDKSIRSEPSESMMFGSYFETLCIGSGAGGRITDDLPRKQLTKKQEQANLLAESKGNPKIYYGEKTIDQIRIEAQASEFKRLCSKYQITIASPYNTQVRIYKQFDENVMTVGELDIFPTTVVGSSDPKLGIIDLKLTANLTSTFGEFAWGDYASMDKIQGYMYHFLVRDIDFDLNRDMGSDLTDIVTKSIVNIINRNEILFLYWVFDYSRPIDKLGNKFYPVEYDKLIEAQLKETIRKCVSLLELYEETGWVERSGKHCANCPIKNCKVNETI